MGDWPPLLQHGLRIAPRRSRKYRPTVALPLQAPYTRQELAAALLDAADFLESKQYPSLANAADMRDLLREAFPHEVVTELAARAKRSTLSVVADG